MLVNRILFAFAVFALCASVVLGQGQQDKQVYVSPDAPKDRPKDVTRDAVQKFEEAIKPYVEKARKSYPDAKKRFLAGLPPKHSFFVTTRLHDEQGRFEQVFVAVTEIRDGRIKGLIASDIELVHSYKRGDSYSFPESELLDWTITKPDGTEEGNFVGKFLDTYNPDQN
ncbi:MAG: DUF2314 domain-containing protein [Acidobacteriota bacterium]|nr:DUF2314 domain-containing protein [Acidobacteriota bacterium]MDQ5835695.1 DUF2314 domain-containing protein [Acidobacteriota bacterium]